MGLRPLEICLLLQRGDRLYTSESDVYRRQILTYKVDPRAERVNTLLVSGIHTRRLLNIGSMMAHLL